MSKARLAAARELINEKNYGLARAILLTIPADETARQWLKRLDQIEPAMPTFPIHTQRRKASRLPLFLLAVAVIILVGLFLVIRNNSIQAAERGRLSARLGIYCIDLSVEADVQGTSEYIASECLTFSRDAQQLYADEVNACNQQSPELDAPFQSCLYREGIVPMNLGILPP